jgi:hypothetical protein
MNVLISSWHGVYGEWKKFKNKEVQNAIFDNIHKVKHMSINHDETIESFKGWKVKT